MTLDQIAAALRATRGFAHKTDIGAAIAAIGRGLPGGSAAMAQAVAVGDDCAAIPDGHGGHLLLAIEGLVEDFVERMPWFAGYCGVMVNVSDVYAMGGRPVAVVDALWGDGLAADVLAGMAAASQRYAVPIVGGHTNSRSARGQLAVAILGRATRLLTSFDARPGDALVMAVDLRGAYQEPYPYWNASTESPPERLRADLDVLPQLAEAGLCRAAKDISMAGALGTVLMLAECSGVGATIDLDALPRPPQVGDDRALLRWLSAFPSYGFVLSVAPHDLGDVLARFHARGLAAATLGEVTCGGAVVLTRGAERTLLWDFERSPFIGEPRAEEAAHA